MNSRLVLGLRTFIVLTGGIFLFGCAQVKQIQNLDELLVLKEYSDEKEAQEKWVTLETARFDLIRTAVEDGSIKSFQTRESLREHFGEPVLIERIQENNMPIERWLYRHPIQKLAFERFYLFFDLDGRLLRFEGMPPSSDGEKIIRN